MIPEDDRTRVIGKAAFGAANGSAQAERRPPNAAAGSAASNNVLPNQTRLGEFEIIDLIGEGGFGIVYLALDHSLERRVALKEYMPSALATRGHGVSVAVKSQRHAETFEAGLRSFVNEAKLLAHFDHPALVKVHRFWEANGTAYMVMPFYEGVTLKQALKALPERPSEAWLKTLLEPLTDALAVMHADPEPVYHRDIAPDNLLILRDGRPVLLDFGAARRVIGDMTQALTVILKPGFAPVEQYAEVPEMKQGPWTDVYALAALIYYSIAGRAPTASVARMMNDTLIPAAQLGSGLYSDGFLRAIDAALVIHPEQRTQSIQQFREDLGLFSTEWVHTAIESRAYLSSPAEPGVAPAPASAAAATHNPMVRDATPMALAAQSTRAPALLTRWLLIPAVLATLALAAGIGWYLHRTGATTQRVASQSVKPNEPAGSVKPASVEAPNPPLPGAGPDAPTGTAPQTPPPADSPSAPGAAKAIFSPTLISDLIHQARAPDWSLSASATPQKVEIDKDFIRLNVRSERAGFVYIFMFGSDTRDWWMIFPNGKDRANKIAAGEQLSLPRKSWPLQAGGPPGVTRFLAMVSETERDFASAGLKPSRDFGRFDLTAAAKAYEETSDPAALFSGAALCGAGRAECTKSFASAQFEIEEIARRLIPKKPSTNPSD